MSFPEVVGKLLAAGVEYYHVDYVGLRKRFYSAAGEMMATSINYEGLPPVAPEFDAAVLRVNLYAFFPKIHFSVTDFRLASPFSNWSPHILSKSMNRPNTLLMKQLLPAMLHVTTVWPASGRNVNSAGLVACIGF